MRQSHYLGDYTALCKTAMGQKVFVDTRDTSITPHLLMEGLWEPWISQAIDPMLRNCSFYDVGANMGWYALLAQHAGAHDIHLYEPNPTLVRLLKRTMWVNGYNWDIHEVALGDDWDQAELNFDYELLGSASLLEGIGETKVVVDVRNFDDYRGEDPQRPAVMKLDVEGFESKVVMGAQNFIRQHKPTIFYEHHSDPGDDRRVAEMFEFFETLSYQIGHVRRNGKIHPISRADVADVPDVDMLCFQSFGS